MFTYTFMNLFFLGLLLPTFKFVRSNGKSIGLALLVLFVLTAIFDSVIIGLGIVDYDYSKTFDIQIINAPIEDFTYALLAGVLGPYLWKRFN